MVAGVGLEPHDLRVMSPTSYQLLYPAIWNCALVCVPKYHTTILLGCQDFFTDFKKIEAKTNEYFSASMVRERPRLMHCAPPAYFGTPCENRTHI